MRGKGEMNAKKDRYSGITPAYAGKSSTRRRQRKRVRDHPRLCGEKFPPIFYFLIAPGSPPPMRGKEVLHPHG